MGCPHVFQTLPNKIPYKSSRFSQELHEGAGWASKQESCSFRKNPSYIESSLGLKQLPRGLQDYTLGLCMKRAFASSKQASEILVRPGFVAVRVETSKFETPIPHERKSLGAQSSAAAKRHIRSNYNFE